MQIYRRIMKIIRIIKILTQGKLRFAYTSLKMKVRNGEQ